MPESKDHLVRTAELTAETLPLSQMTGHERLNLDMHRLGAAGSLDLQPGPERFLYVLEGSGSLHVQSEAEADPTVATLGPGDFVALLPEESAVLQADEAIAILLGRP